MATRTRLRNTMTDKRRNTYQWKRIQRYWAALKPNDCQATTCLLPGIPIRYTQPRGPDSLDVGHIHSVINDPRQAWTIADTRPEHARCNRSAGVNLGRARTKLRNASKAWVGVEQATTSGQW